MWEVKFKKTFLKELYQLPHPIKEKIEKISFNNNIIRDPFSTDLIEKMKGYKNYYKIRIGIYRVGL